MLKLVFAEGVAGAKAKALQAGVSEEAWTQFMAYSSAVFNNCGNFRSFGDSKFVPELDQATFEKIFRAQATYQTHQAVLDDIWNRISYEVYTEAEPHKMIGFVDKNGVTSYYTNNVTQADTQKIDAFCQANKISPLNTRLMKSADGRTFDLRIASKEVSTDRMPYLKSYTLESGETVNVTAGDFGEFMARVTENMEQAKHYTSSENQRQMLANYEEHFRYGE